MERNGSYWETRFGRRRLLRGAGLVVAGLSGAALIGCGDDEEAATPGSSATSTAGPSGTAAGSATVATRKRGGTLRFAWTVPTPGIWVSRGGFNVSFHVATSDALAYVSSDGTTRLDWSLMEAVEYTDPVTLRGKLRQGVTYHDGTSLTAETVRRSIEYLRDAQATPQFGYRALIETLDTVEAASDSELIFHLKQPDIGFLSNLGVQPGCSFSVDQIDKIGEEEARTKMAGTGPYMVESFVDGDALTMVANPNYWLKDAHPYLDKLIMSGPIEGETKAAALEVGDVHAVWFTGAEPAVARLMGNNNLWNKRWEAGPDTLMINHAMAPLDNLHVRKALAFAIDKTKHIEALHAGLASPGLSLIPSVLGGYSDYEPYPYNVEAAKQALADSGLELPLRVTYALGSPPTQRATQTAALFQQQLNEVGFDVQIENVPDVQDAVILNRSHHMAGFPVAVRPNAVSTFQLYATSVGGFNPGRDSADPAQAEMERMVFEAAADYDDESRAAKLEEIHKIFVDNVFCQLPVVSKYRFAFGQQSVLGWDDPEFANTPGGASSRPGILSLA